MAKAKAGAADEKVNDIEDEASSVTDEPGKKRRKKKNKKKKKNAVGGDAISEVSINDQSGIDDSIDDFVSGSQNTRPETDARKHKGQDFTPLKDKIDFNFFDD